MLYDVSDIVDIGTNSSSIVDIDTYTGSISTR